MKNRLATLSTVTFVFIFCLSTAYVVSECRSQDMGMDGGFGMGGGGGLGGMGGAPKPSPLEQAKATLKKAKTTAESESAKQRIKQIVSAKYDAYLADNQRELNSMKQRLEELVAKLELRKQARSRMIQFEVMRIENEMTGLTWPSTDSNQSPAMMGGMGIGMMDGMEGAGGMGMEDMMGDFGTPKPPIEHQLDSLQQIGQAIRNYESIHKHLPAKSINDKSGEPLLSWRVTLLPLIGQVELYNRFKLDEPWDSQNNQKLIPLIPAIYVDGQDFKSYRNGLTRIQIPDGEGAIMNGDSPSKFSDVRDGSHNSILAVQVGPKHSTQWTKPSDWEFDSKNILEKIKPRNGRNALVLMADGSTRKIDTTKASNKEILNLVRIADENPFAKQ